MVDFLLCRRMMLVESNSPFPYQIGIPDLWHYEEDGVTYALVDEIRQEYITLMTAEDIDVKDNFVIYVNQADQGNPRMYTITCCNNFEIEIDSDTNAITYYISDEYYYNFYYSNGQYFYIRQQGPATQTLSSSFEQRGEGWILDCSYNQLLSNTEEVIWQGYGVPFAVGIPGASPASQDFDLSLIGTIRQRYVEFMANRGVDVSSNYTIFIEDVITEGAGGPVSYYVIFGCYGFEIASNGYPLSLTYYNGDNYVQFTYNPTNHTLSNGNYYGVSDNWSYSISDNIANNGKGWVLDSASYNIHSRTDRLCWTKTGIPLTVGIPDFPDFNIFTQEDIDYVRQIYIDYLWNNYHHDVSSNYAIIMAHAQGIDLYTFFCFNLPEMSLTGDDVLYHNMGDHYLLVSYNRNEESWTFGGFYGGTLMPSWALPNPFSYNSLLTTGDGYMIDMAYDELYTRNGDLFWKKEPNNE